VRGVNPEQAWRSLKTLTDVWDVAMERLIAAVTRRLARGITETGWAERKLGETLLVRAELLGIVQRRLASGLEDQALAALEESYGIGARVAEQLGEVAIETNTGRVASLVSRFVAQLRGTWVPVIRAHEDVYRRVIAESETLMATGTIVRREAVAMSVDRLLAEGADRFVDSSGRRWHLDSYVRMAGRTASQQAAVEGQLDGMVERGRDLVVISDSPRECRLCRPWEGRLLSISGVSVGSEVDGHRVAGTVAEARAGGLWHPNCTHRADPYTSGLTEVPEPKANPEGYAAAQKLRRLEREVRELKRRRDASKELGETTATVRRLNGLIRAKHQAIAAHADATGQNRRRERERPVGA